DHLADRKFSTNVFFKTLENDITPSALRFFQVKWHECVDKALHVIGLKSPRFWYEWNEELKPEQKEYPMKPMPFDLYLDMYRSPESVRKEIERKKLERLVREDAMHPTKYPDIFYADNRKTLPPWIHQRKIKENLGQGVYTKLYNDYANPAEQHVTGQQTETEAASKRTEAQAD
ncbi:phosphatidylethanolamine-binding protein, partial [Aphelenchoides avenae]